MFNEPGLKVFFGNVATHHSFTFTFQLKNNFDIRQFKLKTKKHMFA